MTTKRQNIVVGMTTLILAAAFFAARISSIQQQDHLGLEMDRALEISYVDHDNTPLSDLLKSGVSANTPIYASQTDTNSKPERPWETIERCLFVGKHVWKSPLIIAATDRNITAVRLLLSHGADPRIPDGESNEALPSAFSKSVGIEADPSEQISIPIVRLLVKHGADINHTDYLGRSVLSYAVMDLYPEAVAAFLNCGARASARVDDTPLEYWREYPDRARDTLVAFARGGPDSRNESNNNFTWLQIGLADGPDEASELLNLGFAPDSSAIPESSIVEAIRSKNLAIVPTLIGHGADVNAYSNEFNERPIDAASVIQDQSIVTALIRAGAQVDPTKPGDRFAMSIWNEENPTRRLFVASRY